MSAGPDRLSFWRKLGYGVGDFGLNLYYTGLNLFLFYYYTDVLGIRPGVAGLIFALPLVWDAITDPVMGLIANRTRTRWGQLRPYLLFGAIPLAISFVAMFAAPLMFPGAVVAVSAITHVIFRTCYTVVSIPFSALSANMTRDSKERGSLAAFRMFFAPLGGLFTAAITLNLAGSVGGGDLEKGFLSVAGLYGVVATVLLVVTFASARESVAALAKDAAIPPLANIWLLRHNRALWIVIGAIVFGSTGSAIFSKALIYYLQYTPGISLDISSALAGLIAMTTISVPVWGLISRRAAKKTVWLCGAVMTFLLQLFLLLASPTSSAVILTVLFAMGAAGGAYYLTFWSMLPDTVEYGEFRSRVRDEGMVFGLNQLALKAASGLGIGLLGLALETIGYVANQPQTDEAIAGLRIVTLGIPMTLGALSLLTITLYPIDAKFHARLVRAIDWRKARQMRRAD